MKNLIIAFSAIASLSAYATAPDLQGDYSCAGGPFSSVSIRQTMDAAGVTSYQIGDESYIADGQLREVQVVYSSEVQITQSSQLEVQGETLILRISMSAIGLDTMNTTTEFSKTADDELLYRIVVNGTEHGRSTCARSAAAEAAPITDSTSTVVVVTGAVAKELFEISSIYSPIDDQEEQPDATTMMGACRYNLGPDMDIQKPLMCDYYDGFLNDSPVRQRMIEIISEHQGLIRNAEFDSDEGIADGMMLPMEFSCTRSGGAPDTAYRCEITVTQ